MLKPSTVDQLVIAAQRIHTAQAYDLMDRLIAPRDAVTGLLPLHVKTVGGKLVATNHIASGLDMGRTTAGLVMLSQLTRAEGDPARADKYLKEAEDNYKRGKELLAERDYFVQRRDFDDHGKPTTSEIGERGKSAVGEDNMSRVNPRAYAFRAAAELYRATGKESYKLDFERYCRAWIRDFYDPVNGGFFVHANVMDPSDHKEIGSFKDPGGVDSTYDGRRGIKGNDGTIDWKPISADWQSQPIDAPEGQSARTSHVAIGGHTVMAPQQIIEGARQLLKQGKISEAEYASYVDRTLSLFQEFATKSGAIDWNTGAVHNAIRVEEPRIEHRWLQAWGDAPWQQAELIQTLLRFREEDRLKDIKGPNGKTGEELLKLAEQHYVTTYPVPTNYSFEDYLGNPDVYHRPQLALYHHEMTSQLGP